MPELANDTGSGRIDLDEAGELGRVGRAADEVGDQLLTGGGVDHQHVHAGADEVGGVLVVHAAVDLDVHRPVPDQLPQARAEAMGMHRAADDIPHGTTIVAVSSPRPAT